MSPVLAVAVSIGIVLFVCGFVVVGTKIGLMLEEEDRKRR